MSRGRELTGAVARLGARRLGVARSAHAIRLLRATGLYVPLRLLYDGLPDQERQRYRELRTFASRYGGALRGVRTAEPARATILFPQISPGLDRLRIEAMVAKGLQALGCRPVFLLDRHDLWHEEHLRAFGFRDFVFLDDYLPDRAEHDERAAELIAGCADQDDVLALTYREYEVGRHAASRALNRLRQGIVDPHDPALAAALGTALANSTQFVDVVERALADVQPDKLMTSVQNFTPWAEFFEGGVRHGVDVIHWGRSHLECAFLFRRHRYSDRHEHFVTISDESWERLKRKPWTSEDAETLLESIRANYLQPTWLARKGLSGKRPKTDDEIRAELGLDSSKKTAFIFSHLLYDATFSFGESLFPDYGRWLLETVRAACRNPELNWVVKLHPENVRRLRQATGRYALEDLQEWRLLRTELPELPSHIRFMLPDSDTSTVSLFGFADYVLTVRGTVGLEFPCFGVPTLTAGTGGYSGRGFTIDSASRHAYLSLLERLHEVAPLDQEAVALAQRFAHGVLELKPVRMRSFVYTLKPESEHDPGLSAWHFEPRVATADELRRARDLRHVARWILDSGETDLLGLPDDVPAGAERVAALP